MRCVCVVQTQTASCPIKESSWQPSMPPVVSCGSLVNTSTFTRLQSLNKLQLAVSALSELTPALARLESRRPGVRISLAIGFFRGRVIPETSKLGTPVATLPGAWCYRVSAGTGQPGVSIL